ncbi:MAG: hypothetical protein HYV76_02225 [Candidatus Vogelbacteria bacterium]|nr:hypothetical protein [Candidatus Vogelbacteria bacterium]
MSIFDSWRRRKRHYEPLDPDEVMLDSSNLPSFNNQQFEGRIEQAIPKTTLYLLFGLFILIGGLFIGQLGYLQIIKGVAYAERSKNNHLRHTDIYPERGIIYDRNNVELAWNDNGRQYIPQGGFAHVLGYLGYSSQEQIDSGTYSPKEYLGKVGVEAVFNDKLHGVKGIRIEEVDATGKIASDHLLQLPESGKSVTLSIDARVQAELYRQVSALATDRGFTGGSAMIMDVHTGELLALVSYPEYNPTLVTKGEDRSTINAYFKDKSNPFLNRAISGLYTPGSVVKPIVAIGALAEHIITPEKTIFSNGELVVPNPYNPKLNTVFKDWKAHGAVDMRRALAVSSNVYFYEIGGGFPGQVGLGIRRLDKYFRLFGLGQSTDLSLANEPAGSIPTPEWKAENFDGEVWRTGDTYHTTIGQYGMQVTPLQMARVVVAVANGGRVLQPKIERLIDKNVKPLSVIEAPIGAWQVVREGMRLAVKEGTAKGLDIGSVAVAAKSGTAELGVSKERVNSWITGFFPYESPRYVFVVVMEEGPRENLIGGVFIMRGLLDWMAIYTPEYLKAE